MNRIYAGQASMAGFHKCFVSADVGGISPIVERTMESVLTYYNVSGRFQWLRGLRRGSAAARLLGSRVRIPPGA